MNILGTTNPEICVHAKFFSSCKRFRGTGLMAKHQNLFLKVIYIGNAPTIPPTNHEQHCFSVLRQFPNNQHCRESIFVLYMMLVAIFRRWSQKYSRNNSSCRFTTTAMVRPGARLHRRLTLTLDYNLLIATGGGHGGNISVCDGLPSRVKKHFAQPAGITRYADNIRHALPRYGWPSEVSDCVKFSAIVRFTPCR